MLTRPIALQMLEMLPHASVARRKQLKMSKFQRFSAIFHGFERLGGRSGLICSVHGAWASLDGQLLQMLTNMLSAEPSKCWNMLYVDSHY